MKHIKLYEEYNQSNPKYGHPGFFKTIEEAEEFLRGQNINVDFCTIYINGFGEACVDVRYDQWYEADLEYYREHYTDEIDEKMDEWVNNEGMDEIRQVAMNKVDAEEVRNRVRDNYPELIPPEESDFEDYIDYINKLDEWQEEHESDYEDAYNEAEEEIINEISDEVYGEVYNEHRKYLLSGIDDQVEDSVYEVWSNNEHNRIEILIYLQKYNGYLPININMIYIPDDFEHDFLVEFIDIISADGLDGYQGEVKYKILSDKLCTAGNLDPYYIESFINCPILTAEGMPGGYYDSEDYPIDVLISVDYVEHQGGEDSILDSFVEYDVHRYDTTSVNILLELYDKEPETFNKIMNLPKLNNDLKSHLERLLKIDKHKDIIDL